MGTLQLGLTITAPTKIFERLANIIFISCTIYLSSVSHLTVPYP